jgi:prepilin-type N-terminal cleavage/methylation domain-containing protein
MTSSTLPENRGFTLIEILITMAIMGVVLSAVYSVYLTHQKSAYTQEEVVEVQQNLRIAMDSISKDVRMAGMLVPSSANAVNAATANSITINTASARGVYSRIDASITTVVGSSTVTCKVETMEDVDIFKANQGNLLRIIRPVDGSRLFDTTFSFSEPTETDRTNRQLNLQSTSGPFTTEEVIKRGDMIVMTATVPPASDTVGYAIVNGGTVVNSVTCPANQQCITRIANGAAEIIASNISNLAFNYILDDYTETNTPASAELSQIRAVRVTITGRTATTSLLSGGPKTRELTSIIKIRNRRL